VAAWEKGATTMSTADAAVHNFHTLSRDEMTSLLEAVVALGETYPVDPKLPLQVHPVLASQGLSGALWPKIKDIVLEYAGETNLTRMTFMALRANIGQDTRYLGVGWLFSGAELGGATTQRVVVATTTDNEQHFGNNASGASIEDQADFVGDVIPGTKSTDVLLRILADSKAAMALPEADIQAAVDQTFKIENPTTNTLDSIDCVSCHVATTARAWAAENRGIKTDSNPYRYTSSTFDLTLVSDSEDRSNCLRGFGYYGVHSAISQRTVNDTAAGADFINTYFLRRQ
jgi:hypothetical protein